MSRYDDSDDVGGSLSSWDQPDDQVAGRRRWRGRGRQDAGGRDRGQPVNGRGERQPGATAGRRWRTRKEIVLAAAAILATVIVVSTSLVAYAKYRTVYGSIKRVDVSSAELGEHRPPYTAALNILVIGSDSRAGSNGHGNAAVITGARSDTVMLLHIAPGHQAADVISFPRDSMIPIYACQADRAEGLIGQQAQPGALEPLNSTFAYGGPACLWKTLEQLTNINIQHFIELDFAGFQSVIDDVGGVQVCLPTAVDAPDAGLKLPAGIHTVTGAQALAFVRAREGVGDGSDLERIQRQQFFLDAVLKKLKATNLLADPTRILQVVSDAAKSLTVDSGLDLTTMLKIADSMKSLNSGDVDFVSVPNGLYPPDPAKVLWTQPQADQLFKAIASDATLPTPAKAVAKPTASATVSPSQVKVDVLNGAGTANLAATVGTDLTNAGFTVTGTGDVPGFGFTGSVIEYSSASQLPAVNTLKAEISGATVKQDTNVTAGTITLVVGSSFNGLSGAKAASSPSPSASPSSSASNLTKTYGGITGTTNLCADSAAFAP
jgi:LCP family protein required for cell wall assembly